MYLKLSHMLTYRVIFVKVLAFTGGLEKGGIKIYLNVISYSVKIEMGVFDTVEKHAPATGPFMQTVFIVLQAIGIGSNVTG